ncbi:hypothetical protein DYB35_005535, partial [Aphanomyces astaci]
EISATMTMRIQAVESSLGVSEGAFETQDAAVQDMIQAHQQVEEDLRAIFTALKHQRVDPAMSRHNTVDSLKLLRATMSFYQGLDFNGMVPLSSDGQSVWDALGDLCQHLQDELFECKLRHQCDRRILHTFSAMHDTSQAYDAALSECHVLLDELTNLLRFYERFLAAYEALPLELQRRQAYEATTRRLVC